MLTKIFPTEPWAVETETSYLSSVSRENVTRLYKRLWLLNSSEKHASSQRAGDKVNKNINNAIADYNDDVEDNCEDFMTDELSLRQEEMKLSSSQLAQNIIVILEKLVEIENNIALQQTDPNSVTMCCLRFSLDALSHLHDQEVFSDGDQTVIKVNLLELTFLCFNNLVNRDGKSIEPVFKKLFHLLEVSDNVEVSCGLILNILTILNNLCVKGSIQKTENLNMFILCNHLILKRMEILSSDRQLLHIVQKFLIRIIKNIKVAHKLRLCDKKRPKRNSKTSEFISHHDSTADACFFERLLIDSFVFIKSFAKLKYVLTYLRAKGVCCCNGNIETIRIFMRPSLVPMQCLGFIQEEIIQPAFDRKKICIFCNDKLNSGCFRDEYFQLLRCEIQRRQGWELHSLLHHLTSVQKQFSLDFLHKFVFDVIAPTFEVEKVKFMTDPEQNFESKAIVVSCLSIINESMKEETIITQFFNCRTIHHLRDCSLVPSMASNACQLLKIAIDNGKLFSSTEENLAKLVNSILFSNVLYLTRELMELYGQIDLPKDVPLSDSQSSLDKNSADATDFEILDEQTVAVKEELSNMDILLLNTIHWNILCDLISGDPVFQQDFVANIYNNFSGNILFTIAYNALNSILLKNEIKSFQFSVITPASRMGSNQLPVVFERCSYRTPVITSKYDLNFVGAVRQRYHLHEISRSFLEKLEKDEEIVMMYRLHSDNDAIFRTVVHKDAFLTDNVTENSSRQRQITNDYSFWFNPMWLGLFEGKAIRDRFIKIVSKFAKTEDDLRVIYRAIIIKEITSRCGIKYFSSIARNCFDICWRLSDNISFSKLFTFRRRMVAENSFRATAKPIKCIHSLYRIPFATNYFIFV